MLNLKKIRCRHDPQCNGRVGRAVRVALSCIQTHAVLYSPVNSLYIRFWVPGSPGPGCTQYYARKEKKMQSTKKVVFPVLIVVTVTIALIGSAQIAARSAKTIDKNVTGRVSRCSYVNFNVIPRVNS